MSKPILTCYGGVGTVTGANFHLSTQTGEYLVDCGLLQGVSAQEEELLRDTSFEYDPTAIKALFVTHAHVDHIGRIPRLLLAGFKGEIYSTPETKEIAEVMLQDLVRIEGLGEGLVGDSMKLWKTLKYHETKDFGAFTVEIFDAGHILGSGMYKFTFPSGESILFTGDLGNSPSLLISPTDKVAGIKYLLMESVYGDRNHETPEERDGRFRELVRRVVEKKKTLIMPIFSLERTQVILSELDKMYEEGFLKDTPVFLDSPLAIKITHIYRRILGEEHFDFAVLRETAQVRDSQEIARVNGPKIILAGSGMSTAGRILFHEERYLPNPEAIILIVGFQAPGTLGRQIQEGVKEVFIHKKRVPVNAEVVTISGYSAHAGSDQLVDFVSHSKDTLEKVFIAMGEPKASIFLAQRLHDELGVDTLVPKAGEAYELDL